MQIRKFYKFTNYTVYKIHEIFKMYNILKICKIYKSYKSMARGPHATHLEHFLGPPDSYYISRYIFFMMAKESLFLYYLCLHIRISVNKIMISHSISIFHSKNISKSKSNIRIYNFICSPRSYDAFPKWPARLFGSTAPAL